jgi:hypothetical protein
MTHQNFYMISHLHWARAGATFLTDLLPLPTQFRL